MERMSYREEREKDPRRRLRRWFSLKNHRGDWDFVKIAAIIIIGLILLAVFFGTMFYTVGVGEAALIVDPITKDISGPIIGPTWSIKWPWQQAIVIYTAMDSLGMWGDGTDEYADFPTVPCFSKDQLEMNIDVMIRWQLDINKLEELYRQYPACNWKDTTIASTIREQMRMITSTEFSAIQTIEQRDVVRARIEEAIWTKLCDLPSLKGAVINFEFELRNIGYPEKYTSAIEDKLVAEQQKIQADFEREKIIILANATAQQVIIEANAEAEAKVLVANGTREAIELILEASGGDPTNATRIAELYLWVETLKQIAPDIDVFITSEDIPYLISIPTS